MFALACLYVTIIHGMLLVQDCKKLVVPTCKHELVLYCYLAMLVEIVLSATPHDDDSDGGTAATCIRLHSLLCRNRHIASRLP